MSVQANSEHVHFLICFLPLPLCLPSTSTSRTIPPLVGLFLPDRVNPGKGKPRGSKEGELELTSWNRFPFCVDIVHHWDENGLPDIMREPEGNLQYSPGG